MSTSVDRLTGPIASRSCWRCTTRRPRETVLLPPSTRRVLRDAPLRSHGLRSRHSVLIARGVEPEGAQFVGNGGPQAYCTVGRGLTASVSWEAFPSRCDSRLAEGCRANSKPVERSRRVAASRIVVAQVTAGLAHSGTFRRRIAGRTSSRGPHNATGALRPMHSERNSPQIAALSLLIVGLGVAATIQ